MGIFPGSLGTELAHPTCPLTPVASQARARYVRTGLEHWKPTSQMPQQRGTPHGDLAIGKMERILAQAALGCLSSSVGAARGLGAMSLSPQLQSRAANIAGGLFCWSALGCFETCLHLWSHLPRKGTMGSAPQQAAWGPLRMSSQKPCPRSHGLTSWNVGIRVACDSVLWGLLDNW